MKPVLLLFALFLAAAALPAQENLLRNPGWEIDGKNRIRHWQLMPEQRAAVIREGGVNVLKLTPELNRGSGAKQNSIRLAPGAEYLIRGEVKTSGITTGRAMLVIHTYSWAAEAGFKQLPRDTKGKWVRVEQKITTPPSGDKYYSFAFHLTSPTGEAQLKNPELIPLSAEAITGSQPAVDLYAQRVIVPVDPLLAKIPVNDPRLLLAFPYDLPLKEEAYAIRVETVMADGTNITVGETFPLKDGKCTVSLGKVPLGSGTLRLRLEERQSGALFAESTYPVAVIEPPPPSPNLKRLNQLVCEVLRAKAENRAYEFTNPRDGWVYLGVSSPGQAVKGYLDAQTEPVFSAGPDENAETMRYLAAGNHTLRLEGVSEGKEELHIRTVPVLWAYPGNIRKKMDLATLSFDYEFYRKHILPAVNTFDHHSPAAWDKTLDQKRVHELIRRRGYAWNCNTWKLPPEKTGSELETPEAMAERFAGHTAMKNKDVSGLAFDEMYMNSYPKPMLNYIDALRRLTALPKPLYTWSLGGVPSVPELHYDYLSAVANVAGGRGKLLYEYYARTQLTEKMAADYLRDELVGVLEATGRFTANPGAKCLIVHGAYSVPSYYLPYSHPQVDLKYFNEMYFRLLATDPAFRDLHGVGIYATMHADEENFRWLARLLHHYFVEGNTEMLSPQYGFTYLPGHLKNCDFEDGLKHWRSFPAEEKSLRRGRRADYGSRIQRRRGGPTGTGDTYCLFKRSAKAPNRLTQTAENLVPGRYYSLTYWVNDLEEVKASQGKYRRFAFRVKLDGAEIMPEKSYLLDIGFIPERRRKNLVFPHAERIVFKALAPQMELSFEDWSTDDRPGGPEGQELLLNFVSLKPYYPEVPLR